MGEEGGNENVPDIERIVNDFKSENDIDELRTLFVNSSDALSVVLRGHLVLEFCLYRLLRDLVPNPTALRNKLSFRGHIQLLISLNVIPANLETPLLYIEHLRNTFAHDLKFAYNSDHEQKLLDLCPSEIRERAVKQNEDGTTPRRTASCVLVFLALLETRRLALKRDEAHLQIMSRSIALQMADQVLKNIGGLPSSAGNPSE